MDVPAFRYSQGGRTVYALAPTVADMLALIPPRESPEVIEDANRRLFPAHGQNFGDYVWNTPDWVSGALMLGVAAADIDYTPARGSTAYGHATIEPGASTLRLFDGQHRRFGIQYVLERERTAIDMMKRTGVDLDIAAEKEARIAVILADTVPIIMYVEDDLDALRQMYADISHVRVPDPITSARFDGRNPLNTAARLLSEHHGLLVGRVDMERNTIGQKADALMTLNQLSATLGVLFYGIGVRRGFTPDADPAQVVNRGSDFFDDLVTSSATLKGIVEGTASPVDARQRGDLPVNVTMIKVIAAVWRELVIVQQRDRSDVVEFLRSLPQGPAITGVWVASGIMPATTQRATPNARAQEVRTAVAKAVEYYSTPQLVQSTPTPVTA